MPFTELPYDLRSLLIAEDVSGDDMFDRFLLRPNEKEITARLLKVYNAASKLAEHGIRYIPSLMLHGESGCGKTMLARYIAHQAHLPFVYVRFSNLVESYLGKTQSNIAKIFDYARQTPCVLCFDEIDAIGIKRGDGHDVSEMSRVVIALMQEIDRLPNSIIMVGTTNRFDRLDPALVRRFTLSYEVLSLDSDEIQKVIRLFFNSVGIQCDSWINNFILENFPENTPAAKVINICTEKAVSLLVSSVP